MIFAIKAITLLAYTFNTLIFIRVVLSWLGNSEQNFITKFVYEATEPILSPIRKILPRTGMVDFSPLIAIVLIDIIKSIILNSL